MEDKTNRATWIRAARAQTLNERMLYIFFIFSSFLFSLCFQKIVFIIIRKWNCWNVCDLLMTLKHTHINFQFIKSNKSKSVQLIKKSLYHIENEYVRAHTHTHSLARPFCSHRVNKQQQNIKNIYTNNYTQKSERSTESERGEGDRERELETDSVFNRKLCCVYAYDCPTEQTIDTLSQSWWTRCVCMSESMLPKQLPTVFALLLLLLFL